MENEITGFHAAQRFIEPQNHQRFVSTPDQYAAGGRQQENPRQKIRKEEQDR